MNGDTTPISDATAKLIACVLIVLFLAIGLVGLILPIIPGLLFLAIAALIAARHSVTVERMVRRNRTMSGYLDSTDGFLALSAGEKIQFGAWLCLKMLIDGVAFVVSAAAKLFGAAAVKYRQS